jgi:hypothetical protein
MDRTFVFITNNLELPSEQIALLYKNRWQIELFQMDQTTSQDKVLLGKCRECCSNPNLFGHHHLLHGCNNWLWSEARTLNLRDFNSFGLDRTLVKELFSKIDNNDVKDLNINQLSLSLF